MKQRVTLSDGIAAVTGTMRFEAGYATTNGSFWSCDVYLDGKIYCSVCNIETEGEARWRALAIANVLNAAPPEAFT